MVEAVLRRQDIVLPQGTVTEDDSLVFSKCPEMVTSLKVSSWIGSLSMFELAVLDLKETEDRDRKRVMQSTEKGCGNSEDEDGCHSQPMPGDEEMRRI